MYFAEGRDLSRRQAWYLNMLLEFNIKIIYRSRPQNVKADALTRMAKYKPTDSGDERLRQQHQTILTPNRLKLDGEHIDVHTIDDPIYYKVVGANKEDEYCTEIREAIAENKDKFREITLSKYSVQDGVLYHQNRLWISDNIYTDIIREVHDQPSCGHPEVARTYKLLKREYY